MRKNRGFTLAEVMIALVILVIGVLVILRIFPVALGYGERSQTTSRVSILIERKLEEIKSRPYSEVIETYEDKNVAGTEDELSWTIKLDKVTPANVSPASEIRRLIMTVSWQEKGRTRSDKFVTYITNF